MDDMNSRTRTSGFGAHDPDNLSQRRALALEQQETSPLQTVRRAVRRAVPIDKQDTLKTSAIPGDSDSRTTRIPAWFVWLVSLAVVAVGLAIYARSIHILPLGDDWVFLGFAQQGPDAVFGLLKSYHYTPLPQGVAYGLYLLWGLNPVPYHVVDLALFSICVVLTLRLGWKLTGSFAVGVVASLLFVLSGRPYEAVIWTVIAIFQTLGLVFYLGGLLCYLYAQSPERKAPAGGRHRGWLLVGFWVCMILAVFTYEQEVTLVIACMLYRLLVLDNQAGWWRGRSWASGQAWRARARVWVSEFWFPVVFFAGYLVFKVWLGRQTGVPQAPGLQAKWSDNLVTITIGLYETFTPGAVGHLLGIQYRLVGVLNPIQPLRARVEAFALVLTPLAVVIVFARPLYRWLALWAALAVASTILGIGYLASRYELLFLVPAVILWAGFLVWLAKKLRDLSSLLLNNLATLDQRVRAWAQRLMWGISWLPLVAVMAFYGASGVPYISAQVASWQHASDTVGVALQQISALAEEHPQAREIYLVNLPDSFSSPAGRTEHGPYLFLNGAPHMVALTMPGRFQEIHYLRTPGFSSNGPPSATARSQVDTLAASASNLVVCLDMKTGQIAPWGPLCI